jgi:acetyl-CoA synthetase
MAEAKKDIQVLLAEKRVFDPPKELVEKANVTAWMKKHGLKSLDELLAKCQDIEWYWGEMAKELLEFYKPYDKVLEWDAPWAKWFVGGKYNIAHDAVDRHMKTATKDKIAYIFEGETGETKTWTYADIYHEVNRLANAMKSLGVKKGDRVGLYMPMVVELPIAMLACAKIGAIHSVVFSGFSPTAFAERMQDCEAVLAITSDHFWRRGTKVALKEQTDQALKNAPTVKNLIVHKRMGDPVPWTQGRDHWWHEICGKQSDECPTEQLDANDLLYILYTSGTTGRPKGIQHAHAGYAVGTAATLKWVFDLKQDDVWWCAADIGWVTGHSYIVYAPLLLGVTSLLYEGAPAFPQPDRWWAMIEKHKVSVLYTSPTAVRAHMRLGEEHPEKHPMKSLRLLGSVGEPINPEAWIWYHTHVGKKGCPIMDTWWQTETGHFLITPLPLTPLKPGSATKPFPGIAAAVYNEEGQPIVNAGGNLVIQKPWPGMLRGLYKNPDRYKDTYWSKFKNTYLAGDVTRQDQDGYFWIQGRADDVLNVAGHRIGNSEVESALVSHPKVAEAAVIGRPDEVKGEALAAFVVLRAGVQPSEELRKEIREHVGVEIGKIARPDYIGFVHDVPKTRSGKIMRRVIRAKALGEPVGDTSTLANPEAVDEIGKAH